MYWNIPFFLYLREIMITEGDMITQNGISYVVVKIEDGSLWGVSNNAEVELFIEDDFAPDAAFRGNEPL
mgnify:CR=1 FL=1